MTSNDNMLAIIQPYFYPYIGYFQLIQAANKIIFYDDVSYVKKGWINRNKILINGSDFTFTIPLKSASQNKVINDIVPMIDSGYKRKFLAQIKSAYQKAPYYQYVIDLLQDVIDRQYDNISEMAISSILSVFDYLGKEINWSRSSVCSPTTKGMERSDRLIQITKDQGYQKYVNPIGGQTLYNKEYFINSGVELYFVNSKEFRYKQFDNEFVPHLSIIDILMFNDKTFVKELFDAYYLV